MKNFKKFHGNSFHDDISIYSKDNDNKITGTIKLAGKKTVIDLFCEHSVGTQTTDEGWFDLILYKDHKVKGEDKILLRNALKIGGGHYHRDINRWRTKIYPNTIVYDAMCLSDKHELIKATFCFEKSDYFFNYESVEHHNFIDDESNVGLEALNNIRDRMNQYWADIKQNDFIRQDYDFSNPEQVYFIHKHGDELRLQVNEISYHIYLGKLGSHLVDGINISSQAYFSIEFPKFVKIEEAFEKAEAWKFFFNQIAFEKLDLQSFSATASSNPMDGQAEFYCPNYLSEKEKPYSRFHWRHAPFISWKDRDKLLTFMKNWLENGNTRAKFRLILNGTLKDRNPRNNIAEIGALCAAIDTLKELESEPMYSSEFVEQLAQTASEKSVELGSEVSVNRISGLLGSLNKLSLKEKLRRVILQSGVIAKEEDINLFVKKLKRLRQSSAHGAGSTNSESPLAHPACNALKSVCVLFDLNTSAKDINGFEIERLLAFEIFRLSFMEFLNIAKRPNKAEG